MKHLLSMFKESNGHHYEQYRSNEAAIMSEFLSTEFYIREMKKALIAWINDELHGSGFKFYSLTSHTAAVQYKDVEMDVKWAEIGEKAIELIDAFKCHDSEVMAKFIDDME